MNRIEIKTMQLTQECGADVLWDLIARLAGLAKVRQLLVEHPLELWIKLMKFFDVVKEIQEVDIN